MTVGETIADARGAAGLSVDEVSERTRIRETVIRSIEQDDFDALGGDLYVRGYLRAIAGAVGVDPQPLIREFDAVRGVGPAGWPTIGDASDIAGAADIAGVPDTAAGEAADAGEGVDPGEGVEPGEPPAVAEESPVSIEAEASEADAAEAGAADDAVAEDGPAEPPAVAQPPADDGAPAAVDHSTPPDEPAAPDQPTAIDQPAVSAEPAGFGQPAAFDQPTVFDQPAVFDHPIAASDFPTRVDQPAIFFDKPINEDYPTLADQPAILDEPSAVHSWGSQSWNPWGPESVGSEEYYPFWADDAVSDADPAPVAQAAFAEPTVAISAAERATPGKRPGTAVPSRRPERRSRVRGWRWATVISVLVVVVLGVVGVASGQIVAKLRHSDAAPSAPAPVTPVTVTPAAVAPTTPPAPSPTTTPTPTPVPTPTPAPVPIRQLAVSSAVAYGPAGTGDGDHPERASNVIAGYPAQPWQTDWYATARFGALKSGTGLLLDMGRGVTVTSLQIRLGAASGANLQIAVGNSPALSTMSTEASTQNASGPLTLHLVHPTRARYLIIWFTKLPPFAVGQYRASVYSVTVSGRP